MAVQPKFPLQFTFSLLLPTIHLYMIQPKMSYRTRCHWLFLFKTVNNLWPLKGVSFMVKINYLLVKPQFFSIIKTIPFAFYRISNHLLERCWDIKILIFKRKIPISLCCRLYNRTISIIVLRSENNRWFVNGKTLTLMA